MTQAVAGLIELTIDLPDDMPVFDRDEHGKMPACLREKRKIKAGAAVIATPAGQKRVPRKT